MAQVYWLIPSMIPLAPRATKPNVTCLPYAMTPRVSPTRSKIGAWHAQRTTMWQLGPVACGRPAAGCPESASVASSLACFLYHGFVRAFSSSFRRIPQLRDGKLLKRAGVFSKVFPSICLSYSMRVRIFCVIVMLFFFVFVVSTGGLVLEGGVRFLSGHRSWKWVYKVLASLELWILPPLPPVVLQSRCLADPFNFGSWRGERWCQSSSLSSKTISTNPRHIKWHTCMRLISQVAVGGFNQRITFSWLADKVSCFLHRQNKRCAPGLNGTWTESSAEAFWLRSGRDQNVRWRIVCHQALLERWSHGVLSRFQCEFALSHSWG